MAQKPGMSHEEWVKLQELLGHAQESGLVSEALVAMGLGDGLAQQVGSEIENSQQSVVRPKPRPSKLEVALVMDPLQRKTTGIHW